MLSLASVLTAIPVHATISCSSTNSPAWQLCGPVETPNQINLQPSVLQVTNGSLIMAWVSQVFSSDDIYSATGSYNASSSSWNWRPGTIVASLSGTDLNPALVQLQNGTIILFFAYKSTTAGHYQLYYTRNNSGAWTKKFSAVPLSTPTGLNDTMPSAAVSKTGTLWLVWGRDNSTAAGNGGIMRQLWYKTLTGGVWSTEQSITLQNDVNWNLQPSVSAGKDGTSRIAYSRGQGSTGNYQIYLMNNSGSGFSQPGVQLTTQTTYGDVNPSIMQDRNGTFWIFWARGSNSTNYAIYDRSSTNNGATWTSESLLASSSTSDYQDPSAVQSTVDKNIWVFLSYNPSTQYQIWALKTTNPISPVHDVSMSLQPITATSIPCPALAGQICFYQGGFNNSYMYLNNRYAPFFSPAIIPVPVNLQNLGDFSENFTVTLSAVNTTSISLGTQRVILSPGGSSIATFNFNTQDVKAAKYSFSGNVTLPTSETVTVGDKPDLQVSHQDPIHLLPLGDIDQDGSDTITDVSVVFFNYGFGCTSQISCSSRYIAAEWGSLDNTGTIDIIDAGVVAYDYGSYT